MKIEDQIEQIQLELENMEIDGICVGLLEDLHTIYDCFSKSDANEQFHKEKNDIWWQYCNEIEEILTSIRKLGEKGLELEIEKKKPTIKDRKFALDVCLNRAKEVGGRSLNELCENFDEIRKRIDNLYDEAEARINDEFNKAKADNRVIDRYNEAQGELIKIKNIEKYTLLEKIYENVGRMNFLFTTYDVY